MPARWVGYVRHEAKSKIRRFKQPTRKFTSKCQNHHQCTISTLLEFRTIINIPSWCYTVKKCRDLKSAEIEMHSQVLFQDGRCTMSCAPDITRNWPTFCRTPEPKSCRERKSLAWTKMSSSSYNSNISKTLTACLWGQFGMHSFLLQPRWVAANRWVFLSLLPLYSVDGSIPMTVDFLSPRGWSPSRPSTPCPRGTTAAWTPSSRTKIIFAPTKIVTGSGVTSKAGAVWPCFRQTAPTLFPRD